MIISKCGMFQNVVRYGSLQIPDIQIEFNGGKEKESYIPEPVEINDSHVERLSSYMPSENGMLYFSKSGYTHYKNEMKKLYESNGSVRGPWSDVELSIEDHFNRRDKAVMKEKERLQKRLNFLNEVG